MKTYTAKERNMYLTGLAGQNILYNVINVLLASYFLQNVLYIPALAVSVIITVARVWDAFNDPIMGTFVDKTRTKYGKCRPYLLVSPAIILITTIICFLNFKFDTSAGIFSGRNAFVIIWAAFTYILWGMSYTVGDIPLWGITALMTENEKDKQKLLSLARMAAGVGGGIAVLGLQPFALKMTEVMKNAGYGDNSERYGFIIAAVIATVVGCAMFQLTGIGTREKISPSEKSYTVKENFKIMWRNRPFRQIFLSGILSAPRYLMLSVAIPLVTYYYSGGNPLMTMLYIALLGGGLFVGQFVVMGYVPKLLEKMSKKKLYNGANIIAFLPYIAIYVLFLIAPDKLNQPVYLIISVLLFAVGGMNLGITSVLQSMMISDAVDYEEYHYGIRPDGVFFSGQTFIAKISSGIATIVYGIACSIVGFSGANIEKLNAFRDAGNSIREALTTNPEYMGYMGMMFFCLSIPPAIGCILSVIPTWKYCLDDDEHTKIVEELNERHNKSEKTVSEDK